jgi:hypothetical protein
MTKLDLRKELKQFYAPPANKVVVVDAPEFLFLMIDGRIEPGAAPGTSPGFREAMMALYGASFTLKFMSKLSKVDPIDYPVMAVEGLWWMASGGEFSLDKKDDLAWTLMMLQPDHITGDMLRDAVAQAGKKHPNPALARLRLERFHEGLCMQIMHVGPYDTEPQTIERMKAFAHEHGYTLRGKHHEIYLGDPRRAAPDKLKTILRNPIE